MKARSINRNFILDVMMAWQWRNPTMLRELHINSFMLYHQLQNAVVKDIHKANDRA